MAVAIREYHDSTLVILSESLIASLDSSLLASIFAVLIHVHFPIVPSTASTVRPSRARHPSPAMATTIIASNHVLVHHLLTHACDSFWRQPGFLASWYELCDSTHTLFQLLMASLVLASSPTF